MTLSVNLPFGVPASAGEVPSEVTAAVIIRPDISTPFPNQFTKIKERYAQV
jgi:hypothetical protein